MTNTSPLRSIHAGYLLIPICSLFLALSVPYAPVHAQDYLQDSEPVPESADALQSPIPPRFGQGLQRILAPPLFKDWLSDLPPFFSDTRTELHTRSYFFDRNNLDNSDNDAWVLGGSLRYRSGRIRETMSIGAELFTSQKLTGPDSSDGTLLLKPGQEGYTVLGTTFAELEHKSQQLTLFRQRLDLPFLNSQDNRMTPNTFEGYVARGELLKDGRLEYVAAYVARIKKRNATSFRHMSEAAGAAGSKKGLLLAGARAELNERLTLGAINLYTEDTLNTAYSEAVYKGTLGEESALQLAAQFADQRSVGEDLLGAGAFDTRAWGFKSAISYRACILTFALTDTAREAKMRSPFGSYPGYNSMMIEDFNRANELAWRIGLSYDFSRLGLSGLSAFANYVRGNSAKDDDSRESLADREEIDATIDYRFQEGFFEGLWLRLRSAVVVEEGGRVTENYRILLNHSLPLL